MKSDKELLNKLRQLDAGGVKFYDAKQKLIAEGYTETQIARNLYKLNYDGKPDEPAAIKPEALFYKNNPEEAAKMAELILSNSEEQASRYKRLRAGAYFLASRFAPGHHARSYYQLRFSDEIGFPIFTGLFLLVAATLAMFTWDLPQSILAVPVPLTFAYWLIRIILSRR